MTFSARLVIRGIYILIDLIYRMPDDRSFLLKESYPYRLFKYRHVFQFGKCLVDVHLKKNSMRHLRSHEILRRLNQ